MSFNVSFDDSVQKSCFARSLWIRKLIKMLSPAHGPRNYCWFQWIPHKFFIMKASLTPLVLRPRYFLRTRSTWWRNQMETFSALLALCAGNSPVAGEIPSQSPVTRSFDVFFDLRPNKQLNKQSWGWWFETSSRPLWRHLNEFHGCRCPDCLPLNVVLCWGHGISDQYGSVLCLLVSCVTKSSEDMVLTNQASQLRVFHKEWLQLGSPSQWWEMDEMSTCLYIFSRNIPHMNGWYSSYFVQTWLYFGQQMMDWTTTNWEM